MSTPVKFFDCDDMAGEPMSEEMRNAFKEFVTQGRYITTFPSPFPQPPFFMAHQGTMGSAAPAPLLWTELSPELDRVVTVIGDEPADTLIKNILASECDVCEEVVPLNKFKDCRFCNDEVCEDCHADHVRDCADVHPTKESHSTS